MAVYSITNTQGGTAAALTTSALSIIQNNNTTTATRVLIQDILVGASSNAYASTDTAINYEATRTTSTGTGATATNGVPLDVGYRSATSTGWSNHTTTAALSTVLLTLALNQRASQRWVAAPGSELIIPGTNNSGIAVTARSPGYTSSVFASMVFLE